MKIFISWSGERSRIIAEGLNDWLPKVIQAVKPFYSPEIEKGTKGIEEINKTLEGTSFGIICLTPDNIESTWIHYEAGALSKIEDARIWTLLHNLKHSNIVQPLAQFQHTLAKKSDVYKLLDSINSKLPQPLEKSVLKDSFERWWSDFEETLKKAEKIIENEDNNDDKNIRSEREILEEVLELLRTQQRDSQNFFAESLVVVNDRKLNKRVLIREVNFRLIPDEQSLTVMSSREINDALQNFFKFYSMRIFDSKNGVIYNLVFDKSTTVEWINEQITKFGYGTGIKIEVVNYEYDL